MLTKITDKIKQFWHWLLVVVFGLGVVFAAGVQPTAKQVRQTCIADTTKKISERIKDCPIQANERASFKGQEIAKIKSVPRTQRAGYDIEIVDIKQISNGVEVLARAWDANGQIGFGDGTVDIERFFIINPPVLVDDPNGTIVREWVDDITGETKTRTLREDTKEALLQSLEHTIKVKKQKFGSENIVAGKQGNTTTTVYPDAHTESTSVDGLIENTNQGTWAGARDATSGTSASDVTTDNVTGGSRERPSTTGYDMFRAFYLFDTSGIGAGQQVDSATFSLYATTISDQDNDAQAYINVVSSTPASNTALVTGDFDQVGATKFSSDADLTGISTSTYYDWTLNASGEANIDVTDISKFAVREGHDIEDVPIAADTFSYLGAIYADTTGTTQDPKLVVEHSEAAVATPKKPAFIKWN